MTITVYGIKNCNTMKKAFDKLNALGKAYEFFDYKKQLLTLDEFGEFVTLFGDKVINKQGLTYRKLDDDAKAVLGSGDVSAMYEIVKTNQSMIKRPIILGGAKPVIGFDDVEYEQVFG
ncbi:ArsC/Spx/MgsR family protein [Moraxella canis]|uniref:ArsC/Spx/MgsR family protein n=1 Tax=Moraxella canis TaxID=90239 RepID=A0ABZ0WYN4_9GAMM|nr:ArsC/Spx/MgsR family protein [Moraxella canis]WQE04381.1 ArsC/Spx/MgsR family protein [Moraxella canis]